MQTSTLGRAIVVFAMAAALSGCSKSPVAPSNSQSFETASVTATMATQTSFTDDGLYQASVTAPLTSAKRSIGPSSVEAAIHPLDYWRTFTNVTSAYSFAFSDTDTTGRPLWAMVTIDRNLLGRFNILQSVPGDSTHPDSANIIHKPMDESWTRNLLFHRFTHDSVGAGPAWRLVAASGVKVTSMEATTHITSLRIQSQNTGVDTTITDPTRFFFLHWILRFSGDDSVTVTATTGNVTDICVLHMFDHRFRMRNNGDGTFTIGWRTGRWSGWRHFGVNAFSNGTLFDDVAPYDSQTWFIPYTVVSDPVVDHLP